MTVEEDGWLGKRSEELEEGFCLKGKRVGCGKNGSMKEYRGNTALRRSSRPQLLTSATCHVNPRCCCFAQVLPFLSLLYESVLIERPSYHGHKRRLVQSKAEPCVTCPARHIVVQASVEDSILIEELYWIA